MVCVIDISLKNEYEILKILPLGLRRYMENILERQSGKNIEEINLRTNKNVIIRFSSKGGREEMVTEYIIGESEMKEALGYMSNFSMYAYEEQVKAGFLTVRGGHRIGISGRVVVNEGEIRTIKNINSLNIRVAHEIKGCADRIMSCIMDDGFENTLIISPPCMGKTTLLREMIRQLSDNYKYKLGVIDERGEIAACFMGIPQNDVGIRTDVMDGCPKCSGISMMIRSMSPDIVAVDEIGTDEDVKALSMAGGFGGKILGTIHGNDIMDVVDKRFMNSAMEDKFFKNYIVLSMEKDIHNRDARIARIYDESRKLFGEIIL